MSKQKATISLTKPDADFFIWFRDEEHADHKPDLSKADLLAGKLEKEIEITKFTMYVYIWFELSQPEAKFTLKLGDKVIEENELTSNWKVRSLPKVIDTIDLV